MSWRDVPCKVWTGARNDSGYGYRRGPDGRVRSVHVLAWEAEHGPVPAGLQLDHLCRNRACWETAHLEPVTHLENNLRGHGKIAAGAAGTCMRGHTDVYRRKGGPRAGQVVYCRECRREATTHG